MLHIRRGAAGWWQLQRGWQLPSSEITDGGRSVFDGGAGEVEDFEVAEPGPALEGLRCFGAVDQGGVRLLTAGSVPSFQIS